MELFSLYYKLLKKIQIRNKNNYYIPMPKGWTVLLPKTSVCEAYKIKILLNKPRSKFRRNYKTSLAPFHSWMA